MPPRNVPTTTEIATAIHRFLVEEFHADVEGELTLETPLLSGGIVDSIALLKLIDHLEATYEIEVQAYEANADRMDTIVQIAELIHAKMQ